MLALFLAGSLSLLSSLDDQVVACRTTCERTLPQGPLKVRVCARCAVAGATDRGAWAAALGEQTSAPSLAIAAALAVEDWAVRYGAVRALARLAGSSEARQLALHVVEARPGGVTQACATLAHVAGQTRLSPKGLLSRAGTVGVSAVAICDRQRRAVVAALELELYDGRPTRQREALEHLAWLKGEPAIGVLIEAMRWRPSETDPIAAGVLISRAEAGGPPVGREILSAGVPLDPSTVNRLLTVLARLVDEARAKLSRERVGETLEAIAALSNLGPLGASALEPLVTWADPSIRAAAARALARGEGRSVVQAARARALSRRTLEEARGWLEVAAAPSEEGCVELLQDLAKSEAVGLALRAAALGALGRCAGGHGFTAVRPYLRSAHAPLRVAALEALVFMPREREGTVAATRALEDPEPGVVVAALALLADRGAREHVGLVGAKLEHADSRVRAAACAALGRLGATSAVAALGQRLVMAGEQAEVRMAAVRALTALGGPGAVAALARVANDSHGAVAAEARAGLRRLGF